MMGWDDEDDRACKRAQRTGSTVSDFEALLWYATPCAVGGLILIATLVFRL